MSNGTSKVLEHLCIKVNNIFKIKFLLFRLYLSLHCPATISLYFGQALVNGMYIIYLSISLCLPCPAPLIGRFTMIWCMMAFLTTFWEVKSLPFQKFRGRRVQNFPNDSVKFSKMNNFHKFTWLPEMSHLKKKLVGILHSVALDTLMFNYVSRNVQN